MARKLTNKRAAFVREYLKDCHGRNAAIRAGYSERSARFIACELLQDPAVQAAVQAGQRAAAERSDVTVDEIIREYRRIAFSNLNQYLSFGPNGVKLKSSAEIDEAALAAVREISERAATENDVRTVSFRLHSKTAALAALAKHLGMFSEKLETKVQAAVEELLGKIQHRVPAGRTPDEWAVVYAELCKAIAAEMEVGVESVASGGTPSAGDASVH